MNTAEKCEIVIPARLASTRLPGKILLAETGKPLIQHVWEGACQSKKASGITIATDDEKILRTVEAFGGRAVMTSRLCACGTDRIAEVAREMPDVDIFVNVQGDEPEILGDAIDTVASLLLENPQAVMATLATPIREKAKLDDPACVKVVFDRNGRALYFSRSVIPYPRGGWDDAYLSVQPPMFYQHLGIYAYRRDFLLKISTLPQTVLEKTESLEQLRVLENGYDIRVGVVPYAGIGIDTPEDYREFVAKWQATHMENRNSGEAR
ncbi:MAG: 3-deoxy-manno-octulosonate cytidylyltransferase [Planctomycetia bacterium]|nr:3-deoxy-manno-octulosonate cytidylyltransferase [Planctomycetia bacterium]